MVTLHVNKFLGALTNLVTLVTVANTFSGTGVGRLTEFCKAENLDAGGTKIVQSVDVLTVEDYDENRSPWSLSKPTVNEQQMDVTDYKVIPLSLSRWLLKGAFLDEYATANYIGYCRSVMEKTKAIYMYRECVDLISGWATDNADYQHTGITKQAGQVVEISLFDASAIASSDPVRYAEYQKINANAIAKALINVIRQFQGPTDQFNDLGYTELIDNSLMGLMINTKFDTDLLVDTFASLLRSEKIAERFDWGETLDIPESQILESLNRIDPESEDNPEVAGSFIGVLAHKGKFQFGYFYEVMASIFNPANLVDNDFTHFAYYRDYVDSLPAIYFKAKYTVVSE